MNRRAFLMAGAVFFGSEAAHVEQPVRVWPSAAITIPGYADDARVPLYSGEVRFGPRAASTHFVESTARAVSA